MFNIANIKHIDSIKRIVFKKNETTNTPWIFLSLNIILFITFSAIAFYHNSMFLFYSTDGNYMLTLAREDKLWRGLEFGLTNNFLQSNGDIWFPMNTRFFPGYIIASLVSNVLYSQVAAYTIFAFEFFLIGLLVARVIGLGWSLAMAAGWLLPLVAYPYYYYPILYNIMQLVPQIGTMIAVTNLMIILFVYLGRGTTSQFLLSSVIIALLLIYVMIASPTGIILNAPIIAIVCTTYLLSCNSVREKKLKLIFVAGITVFSIPLIIYLYNLLKFSVSYFLAASLNYGFHTIQWYYISILFHGPEKIETWLFAAGLIGIIFCSFFGSNFRKSIARGVLVAVMIIVGFGVTAVHYSFWTGPMPLYFEFMLWPFYIGYAITFISYLLEGIKKIFAFAWQVNSACILISAAVLVGAGIAVFHYNYNYNYYLRVISYTDPIPFYVELILWSSIVCYVAAFAGFLLGGIQKLSVSRSQLNFDLVLMPAILVAPWGLFHFANPIGDCWNIPKPPTKSAIVEVLNNEISLSPGKQFNGRVVNFTGLKINRPVTWGEIAANDNDFLFKSGNDHRMNGLWFYNIPTLEIYNPIISPAYFELAKSLFTLPTDEQIRTVITMRHPNVRWLEALGVKFVITDVPLKSAIKRKVMFFKEQGNLYLYELLDPNIGQYSPTKVIKLDNSNAILAKIKEQGFDPKSEVITDATVPDKMVKAKDVKLFADKGFITVTASSQGNSLILLPLEFSHCMSIKSHDANGTKPLIFRANLAQTGVLFHQTLNASIRYFTGPFKNSTCRLKDAKDFEKLLKA